LNKEYNMLKRVYLEITNVCNLACAFCPGTTRAPHFLTEEEFDRLTDALRGETQYLYFPLMGEPLLHPQLETLLESAAEREMKVCITTNGTLLPSLAHPLREAGVSRVNISLDTLDADKFRYISRCGELSQAVDGIRAALEAGFDKVKLNTVLIGGFNDEEIPALAELTRRYPLDVRFIELMPMYDSGDFGPEAFIPYTVVLDKLPELVPVDPDGGVAKLYRLPGALGSIGLISPVSAHFCAACNRIRLTADGRLKPCLHSGDEYSLKGLDYDGMVAELRRAIVCKPSWHGVLNAENRSRAGRNMNQIGG